MNQYKRLLSNVGVLTLSNFATKIISFLLIPLYTSILTTGEYGTYDLLNTTVALCIPIITLSIQDGVLRFALDKNADLPQIFCLGFNIFGAGSCAVFLLLVLNVYIGISDIFIKYAAPFFFLYCVNSLSGILSYFVRGFNKIRIIAIGNFLAACITLLANILFLVMFRFGLTGYFAATILGQLTLIIYLLLSAKLWRFYSLQVKLTTYQKEILRYSVPMIANAVSWWVNGAADRYVITAFCGLGVNGIYAVAHRIPTIITTFQNIFTQAWSVSVVQDYDVNDSKGFYTNTYFIYNFLLVVLCSTTIVLNKIIARILFANDFFEAWKYAPFLMISTLFSGLAGYLGGILSALKKTNIFAITSSITAIINLVLNIVLVQIIGAAVATVFAFFIMWLLRMNTIKKYVRIKINVFRDVVSYVMLTLQATCLLFIDTINLISPLQFILWGITVSLYFREVSGLFKTLIRKLKNFIF